MNKKIIFLKNRKGQLFALELKELSIGFLVGFIAAIILLVVLIKTGKIPWTLVEKLAPVIAKK
jgi:type III secretory pathway component EscT